MDIKDIVIPTEDTDLQAAIDAGYRIVRASPAPDDLIKAARAEVIHQEPMVPVRDGLSFVLLPRPGPYCEALFNWGIDFSRESYLVHLLGVPYAEAVRKHGGPVVMAWNVNKLPRMPAWPGEVVIWRSFGGPLNSANGLFRPVKRSRGMDQNQAQAKDAPLDEVNLWPGDIFIMDGDLPVDWPKEGFGYGQYVAFEKRS